MYKSVLLTVSEIKVLEQILEQNMTRYEGQKEEYSPVNLTILLNQFKRLLINQN